MIKKSSNKPSDFIRTEKFKGLTGRVPTHIKNLQAALMSAVPPKPGQPGYFEYKRKITDLIGDLHFHLSNLD